ncbi:MAG: hypothetical protein V4660_05350 [Pseudomonadota bacterium]
MKNPFFYFNKNFHFLFRWNDYSIDRDRDLSETIGLSLKISHGGYNLVAAFAGRSSTQIELIRCISSGVTLHLTGIFSKLLGYSTSLEGVADEQRLLKTFNKMCTDRIKIRCIRELGLTPHEVKSVEAYTNANKSIERFDDGTDNPYCMTKVFGPYRTGWAALSGALQKIPNFGQLGLTVTTMRTVRNKEEIDHLNKMPLGSRFVTGASIMEGGQRHFTSTAITMSKWTHPDTVRTTGGVICYFGVSGVFINWLGVQSMAVDGGEVLYPPGTIMQLSAVLTDHSGYWNGRTFEPIFLMEEIPDFERDDVTRSNYYNDLTFATLTADDILAARLMAGPKVKTADILGIL